MTTLLGGANPDWFYLLGLDELAERELNAAAKQLAQLRSDPAGVLVGIDESDKPHDEHDRGDERERRNLNRYQESYCLSRHVSRPTTAAAYGFGLVGVAGPVRFFQGTRLCRRPAVGPSIRPALPRVWVLWSPMIWRCDLEDGELGDRNHSVVHRAAQCRRDGSVRHRLVVRRDVLAGLARPEGSSPARGEDLRP